MHMHRCNGSVYHNGSGYRCFWATRLVETGSVSATIRAFTTTRLSICANTIILNTNRMHYYSFKLCVKIYNCSESIIRYRKVSLYTTNRSASTVQEGGRERARAIWVVEFVKKLLDRKRWNYSQYKYLYPWFKHPSREYIPSTAFY